MSLIVMPGTTGPLRPLVEVLRAEHEDRRSQWKLDSAFREKHGVPSTPDIDWRVEKKRVEALLNVVEMQDAALGFSGYTAGMLAMQAAPRDPGEFQVPDGVAGLNIAPKHLPATQSKALRHAWAEAVDIGEPAAINAAQRALVVNGIPFIEGEFVEGDNKPERKRLDTADVFDELVAAGLLPWLLNATLYLQSLPSGKAYRSGVLPPST